MNAVYLYIITAVFTLFTADLQAEPRQVPVSREQVQLSYAPLVAKVAPAVVNIFAERKVRVRTSPFANDPFFSQFFGRNPLFNAPIGRSQEKTVNSLGSGVIVSKNGLVMTNLHVVKNMGAIRVVLSDKRELTAEIVLEDPRTDLALLKLQDVKEDLPFLKIGDDLALEVGDIVLAIGNPFGVGQTVTSGIVSALARTTVGVSDYQFFIQTDAAINPGNSGGALVNLQGELVGINTAIYSKSGASHGIGFATPASMVKVITRSYAQSGGQEKARVIRPWLGTTTQDVTPDIAESMGLSRPGGVLISGIKPGSPAEQGGLSVGDVVIAVDGDAMNDQQSLKFRVGTYPIGSSARFTVVRGNQQVELDIPMQPAPETIPRNDTLIEDESPLAGARVANLSPALAEELRLSTMEGVVITAIERKSYAARFFQPGDRILEINGNTVETVSSLLNLLSAPARGWKITADRGGRIINISIFN